mmetsp:Transcript_30932/g.100833  ORF Transcript_30932/g.100833 Transcript_30932/m.100833 type:complete len:129 (-) Transcript_30932:33-419(-)
MFGSALRRVGHLRIRFASMSTAAPGPIASAVREKLSSRFAPTHLEVINESHMHSVPKNSETHFKVVVVSGAFDGVSLIDRHRQVNEVLKEEMGNPIHALSIVAKTPAQWAKRAGPVESSPSCRGGFGH